MRTSIDFVRGLRVIHGRIGSTGGALLLALVMTGVAAAPAEARSPSPRYTLSITEGETTQPEHSIISTVGRVESEEEQHASVAVSIIRGGVEVSRSSGGDGYAGMSSIPAPGDVVNLELPTGPKGHPGGRIIGSFVYDGRPSIDPTVCAGSVNFSGQRSTGQTIQGGNFLDVPGPYGNFSLERAPGSDHAVARRGRPSAAASWLRWRSRGDGVAERVAGNAARGRSRLHLRKRKRATRGRVSAATTTSTLASCATGPGGLDLQARGDHDPPVAEVRLGRSSDDQSAGYGRPGSLPPGWQTAGVRGEQEGQAPARAKKSPRPGWWRADRRPPRPPARSTSCSARPRRAVTCSATAAGCGWCSLTTLQPATPAPS